MKYTLLLLVLFLSIANATVYRSVDSQGNVVFSDQPSEGAEKLVLPKLPTYSPTLHDDNSLTSDTDNTKVSKEINYQISVIAPKPNQTFWDNSGDIMITAALSPQLDISQKHSLQFSIDGKIVVKSQPGLSYKAQGLDRGSHIIVVSVVDEQGKVLKRSKSLLFHLKKHSANSPANLKNKPQPVNKTP